MWQPAGGLKALAYPSCKLKCARALETAILQAGPENVSAFIADEVMCGLGRTGAHFAIDHWSTTPDLIAAGKGLGI